MILTRDNILRFVREKKYVTPTNISESFETTTMIASAALSEIAKDKLISISNLKIGSTPYYYDSYQKSCLIELGEKHFSGNDKDIFLKLKQTEILNDNSLSIQEKLAVGRIKDFAKSIEIEFQGKILKFWVWYLRNLDETRKLIIEALNQDSKEKKEVIEKREKETLISNQNSPTQFITEKEQRLPNKGFNSLHEENKTESFIERYIQENYLKIESKNKSEKGILYSTILRVNKVEISVDCFYYYKKPSEADLISFYTSCMKPKIVFIENCPKKLFVLSKSIENLTLVNI